MICERIEELLSGLIDNELDPRTAAEVTAHLEQCPSCSQTLQELRLIVQKSAEMEPLVPPDRLYWSIRRQVRVPQHQSWLSPRKVGWVLIPALATIALMVVLFPRDRTAPSKANPLTPPVAMETHPAVSEEASANTTPAAVTPGSASHRVSSKSARPVRSPVAPQPEVRTAAMTVSTAAVDPSHSPLVRTRGIVDDRAPAIASSMRNAQQALEEIEAALRQNPGNPQVQAAYRATYQKAMDLKYRSLGAR